MQFLSELVLKLILLYHRGTLRFVALPWSSVVKLHTNSGPINHKQSWREWSKLLSYLNLTSQHHFGSFDELIRIALHTLLSKNSSDNSSCSGFLVSTQRPKISTRVIGTLVQIYISLPLCILSFKSILYMDYSFTMWRSILR